MSDLLEIIASYDWRFVIGWGGLWYGLGAVCVGLAWMFEKHREVKQLNGFMEELFGQDGVGHVIDIHPTGNKDAPKVKFQHAHCLCKRKVYFAKAY